MKRACGAPWVSKSTHPRTFGNHVTVHRPPSRTTGKPMFNLTLSCTHIAHQCYDQLTAVRTGYQLSSITWPYRGLRCCPFEVEYVFEVIRWQVTSFQMIASSRLIFLIHMKYVVCCMCHTIKILLSNWPRKLEFSQFLQAGRTCQLLMTFLAKITGWSRSTSNFMLWLVKIWQVSSCGKFTQHFKTCLLWQLKLTEFFVNLWCF